MPEMDTISSGLIAANTHASKPGAKTESADKVKAAVENFMNNIQAQLASEINGKYPNIKAALEQGYDGKRPGDEEIKNNIEIAARKILDKKTEEFEPLNSFLKEVFFSLSGNFKKYFIYLVTKPQDLKNIIMRNEKPDNSRNAASFMDQVRGNRASDGMIKNFTDALESANMDAARKKMDAVKKGGAFEPASGRSSLEVNVGESGAAAMKETTAPASVKVNSIDAEKAEIVKLALWLKEKEIIRDSKVGVNREELIKLFLTGQLEGRYTKSAINKFAGLIGHHYEQISIVNKSVPEEFISAIYRILALPGIRITLPAGIPRATEIKFGGEGKPGEAKPGRIIPGK